MVFAATLSRMTPPQDTKAHAPRRPGVGDTRNRFLLARKQAASHASAANYCRVRETGSWSAPRRDQ
jgi:hypothetical protein